jgi:hypothetical protein
MIIKMTGEIRRLYLLDPVDNMLTVNILMQVRRRRQADGEAVQVLQPEAERPGIEIHSAQGKFV